MAWVSDAKAQHPPQKKPRRADVEEEGAPELRGMLPVVDDKVVVEQGCHSRLVPDSVEKRPPRGVDLVHCNLPTDQGVFGR